ncbi:lytic transglycosylase domain-containing protein [Clostridium chrysemydis]|uniref:lytic transglycosylase domain-containing protein n=1 Tax=Clostridium chrysemydis TaxID=2665504 RepID=UPI003F2B6D78
MELNKISNDMMVKMGLMSKVLKSAAGDGMQFDVLYQSLLKAVSQNEDSQKLSDNIMSSIPGQNLQAMDMLIGQADYKNQYASENLSASASNNIKGQELSNIKEVNPVTEDAKMKQIYASVNKYSKQYGVDPNFVLGIIKAESNFNPKDTSPVGAMGLMQLMPETASYLGVKNPYDIDDNIKGGVKYISQKIKQYNGSKEMALMAYNAGSGTMQRRGVSSTNDLYKMPSETRNYVPKVMGYYRDFATKSI